MSVWLSAARPKTLVAVLSPIAVGLAMALEFGQLQVLILIATIIAGLSIQIGTNFANDYLDFARGGDTHERLGPARAVASGWITPKKMKSAMIAMFAVAMISTLFLLKRGGWPIATLGIIAITLGYAYSGGPLPLSTTGLADPFVLLFFGPVATACTFFLQTGRITCLSVIMGFGPGALALAILTCNNLRDHLEDSKSQKRTLIVRFGLNFGKWQYTLALITAFVIPMFALKNHYSLALSSIWMFRGLPLVRGIWKASEGSQFLPFLEKTALLTMGYAILFTLGWIIQ